MDIYASQLWQASHTLVFLLFLSHFLVHETVADSSQFPPFCHAPSSVLPKLSLVQCFWLLVVLLPTAVGRLVEADCQTSGLNGFYLPLRSLV